MQTGTELARFAEWKPGVALPKPLHPWALPLGMDLGILVSLIGLGGILESILVQQPPVMAIFTSLVGGYLVMSTWGNWQNWRYAPGSIRNLLADSKERCPCRMSVEISGIATGEDIGVVAINGGMLRFEGLKTAFALNPVDFVISDERSPVWSPGSTLDLQLTAVDARVTLDSIAHFDHGDSVNRTRILPSAIRELKDSGPEASLRVSTFPPNTIDEPSYRKAIRLKRVVIATTMVYCAGFVALIALTRKLDSMVILLNAMFPFILLIPAIYKFRDLDKLPRIRADQAKAHQAVD
jgi:hypothetical protein